MSEPMITKYGKLILIMRALRDYLRQRNVDVGDYAHWIEIERKRHVIHVRLHATVDNTNSFKAIALPIEYDSFSQLRGTKLGSVTASDSNCTGSIISLFGDPGCFQEIFEFVMSKKHK